MAQITDPTMDPDPAVNSNYAQDLIWGPGQAGSDAKQTAQIEDAVSLGMANQTPEATREAAVNALAQLRNPKFVAPQYAGNYNPQMYSAPIQAQASLAQDSPDSRTAAMQALQGLMTGADQSATSQAALGRYQAGMDAAQFANAREQAIRQQAMSTGQIGGPADMISRMQAAQSGANQNLNLGLQSAAQAALQKIAAYGQAGGLAGQIRGQDQNLAFANQNAINQFNLWNTGNRNAINQANVGLGNQAQMMNLGAQQDILTARAGAQNQSTQGAMDMAGNIANVLTGNAAQQQQGNQYAGNTAIGLAKILQKGVGAGTAGSGAAGAASGIGSAAETAGEWL